MHEKHDDLLLLICRHLDGLTTEIEAAALADHLRDSAEARRLLIEMTLQARRLSEPLRERVQEHKPEPRTFRLGHWAAVAALVVIAIGAWFVVSINPPKSSDPMRQAPSAPVASSTPMAHRRRR